MYGCTLLGCQRTLTSILRRKGTSWNQCHGLLASLPFEINLMEQRMYHGLESIIFTSETGYIPALIQCKLQHIFPTIIKNLIYFSLLNAISKIKNLRCCRYADYVLVVEPLVQPKSIANGRHPVNLTIQVSSYNLFF